MNDNSLGMTVYSALAAALIAAGAFLIIPIGPVPIALQNMMVLLTGLMLGPKWGAASVAVYLLAGAVGLPVFTGGSGGLGRFFGPTGGYLLGYLPAAAVCGWMARTGPPAWWRDLGGLIAGAVLVYLAGVPVLKLVTHMGWAKAVSVGFFPFIIPDAVKIAACLPVAAALRSMPSGVFQRPVSAGRVESGPGSRG